MITSLFSFTGRKYKLEGDENINLQWIFENTKDELNAVKFLQRFNLT